MNKELNFNKKSKYNYNSPSVQAMFETAKKYMNFSDWQDEFIVEIENPKEEKENGKK